MEQDNRCTIPFEGSLLLRLHLGTVSPCCKMRDRPFVDTLLVDIVPEVRKAVLNNQRHPECNQCWKQEDIGQLSYRQLASEHIAKPEKWKNKWQTLDLYQPVHNITLIFSNKCQLMCAYCAPSVSSMWEDSGNRFVKFKGEFNRLEVKAYDLSKLSEFISASKLETLIISGGEPMMDEQCIRFLQELEPSLKRRILIITNLSYGQATMNSLMSILERHINTTVAVSLDTLGDNISRKYLNWDLWKGNFEVLVQNLIERKKVSNVRMRVLITVSILNYMNIQPIIEYIISFRKQGITYIEFNISPLADDSLCSLSSGEKDASRCVKLSDVDASYLTRREILMIDNLNNIIITNRQNTELESLTKEFLLEYMK